MTETVVLPRANPEDVIQLKEKFFLEIGRFSNFSNLVNTTPHPITFHQNPKGGVPVVVVSFKDESPHQDHLAQIKQFIQTSPNIPLASMITAMGGAMVASYTGKNPEYAPSFSPDGKRIEGIRTLVVYYTEDTINAIQKQIEALKLDAILSPLEEDLPFMPASKMEDLKPYTLESKPENIVRLEEIVVKLGDLRLTNVQNATPYDLNIKQKAEGIPVVLVSFDSTPTEDDMALAKDFLALVNQPQNNMMYNVVSMPVAMAGVGGVLGGYTGTNPDYAPLRENGSISGITAFAIYLTEGAKVFMKGEISRSAQAMAGAMRPE
jgi:hypothetical protein